MKISVSNSEHTSSNSRDHLRQALLGAMEADSSLDTTETRRVLKVVEVVTISLTTWFPYGHLYVKMVINDGGKKKDPAVTLDPSRVKINDEVSKWIRETLLSFLAEKIRNMEEALIKTKADHDALISLMVKKL